MCYSAMVEHDLKRLGIAFEARVQLDLFEELFRRRLVNDRVKIPRALEVQFEEPTGEIEERIHQYVQAYRAQLRQKYTIELERQRSRLANASRKLALRVTKGALEERRRSEARVGWLSAQLEGLERTSLESGDARIFPFWYAPVVVEEHGQRWIRPMRYHCRGQGKPENWDARYPGLYNARRDSLEDYWREQFGVHHAIVVMRRFYENVPRHVYEHRILDPGERAESLVIEFAPESSSEALHVACLWDSWQSSDNSSLLSFAAVTDTPPAEVASSGHDRCVIMLRKENDSIWLNPEGRSRSELQTVLDERVPIVLKHREAG